MNDIAQQAKQLLYHQGSPTRRAVPRVCPMLAGGHHQMVGEGDAAIAAWRLEGEDLGGPAVLLVHGWEDDTTLWTALTQALQARGKAVIGFDLPAHGYSAGDVCSVDLTADAIARVVGALGPVDAVACHSFGGVGLAGALMQGLDVKNVVLIAPPTFQAGQYERQWRRHGVNDELVAAALALGQENGHFFDLVKVAKDFTPDAFLSTPSTTPNALRKMPAKPRKRGRMLSFGPLMAWATARLSKMMRWWQWRRLGCWGDQTGSRTDTRNPPSADLSNVKLPPCERAASLARARPKPTPLRFWLRAGSRREKGLSASS
jgi:pimeloyl-ACP methyl ester carboxylesterase